MPKTLKYPDRHFRIVAVQPHWHLHNFLSAQAFASWMQSQLRATLPYLQPRHPNLVVLTELNGLPLILRNRAMAANLGRFEWAVAALIASSGPSIWRLCQQEQVSALRALQLLTAISNLKLYLHICKTLAVAYGVYLCCGSLPVPRLYLANGRVKRHKSLLTNQSIMLDPAGQLIAATDKVFLTPMEQSAGLDFSVGNLDELRVFPTAVGDLGTATSLDAFRPEVIARLRQQGCTVMLQPDANANPWTGTEQVLPLGVSQARPQPVAWLESAWSACQDNPNPNQSDSSVHPNSIEYAVNPMVVGNLLDLSFDGQSAIVQKVCADTMPTNSHSADPQPKTATANDQSPSSSQNKSYVMTPARAGFLALMPWVSASTSNSDNPNIKSPSVSEELPQIGQQLAAGSGHPRENCYRSGIIWADAHLPASQLEQPDATEHERALVDLLR